MADGIRVPTTLQEFYSGLGTAILVLRTEEYYADSATLEALMSGVPEEHRIESAKRWCEVHRSQLRSFAAIAMQARRQGSNGDSSMILSIVKDSHGCHTFMRCAKPSYFAQIVTAGMKLQGKPFQNFLTLLEQLGS